jgi:hypothetical protein
MEIICLFLKAKNKSNLDPSVYIAFIRPAFAGNHVTEATLLLSTMETEAFDIPTFNTYSEAAKYAHIMCFGPELEG